MFAASAASAVFETRKLFFFLGEGEADISDTHRASDVKRFRHVSLNYSPYMSTSNDVTSYFRSAANRIDVSMLGHVLVAISR